MKTNLKPRNIKKKKPALRRKTKASTDKPEVEIVGSLVTLRGQAAKDAKKICENKGVPLDVLTNETMRVFIALGKTEKAKRIEDFHWAKYRAALFKRLDAWKQKRVAKAGREKRAKGNLGYKSGRIV